jgi:phospholipase C
MKPLEGVYGTALTAKYPAEVVAIGQFATDAGAGKLPAVSFIDAGPSEHPPQDMQLGEVAVESAWRALAGSPQWKSSVFFLTYDENGGLYDSVPPPRACLPDAIKPAEPGAFDHYGFRVPLIAAGPWVKPHYVSHVAGDHTALLRFLELRFGLPALSARDANAGALIDLFDFSHPSFAAPPPLPTAKVDPAKKC